ncbi:MAG: GGDEF domain-containing protein, partial [Planktomarina sp.]
MSGGYRPMGLEGSTVFDTLCPFHVRYDLDGKIISVGPTMAKLRPFDMIGMHMTDVFEIISPKDMLEPEQVQTLEGPRLHLRFSHPPRTPFKGDISAGFDAFVANLSFNHAAFEAIKVYNLTVADFAHTDMAIELLYLLEAKTAMQGEVEALLGQLHKAKSKAEVHASTDQLTGLKN